MDTTATKELVRRYWNAWNAHDIEGAAALVAENVANHAAIPEAQGRDGFRRIMKKLLKATPDLTATVEDVIADGDKVVCRVTMRGTHTGELDFVRMQLPATNQRVSFEAIFVFRVASGVFAEVWSQRDESTLLRQLGMRPLPAAIAATAEARS